MRLIRTLILLGVVMTLLGCPPKPIDQRYLVYLPNDYEQQEQWPLMLFLHGAGERGNDLDLVKVHGPPKLIEAGESFPFIVIAPQVELGGRWTIEFMDEVLADVMSKYKVDGNRIYLTGLSMGGYGTWAMAIAYPDRFAAIAPICGGGDPDRLSVLASVPAWVFHGAKDLVVPLKKSREMVDALKAAGGEVQFTIYPEAGHDSWTETYNDPQLYEWMLEQERR